MTATWWGALFGGLSGLGIVSVLAGVTVARRTPLAVRVLPYVRDLPGAPAPVRANGLRDVLGPLLPWLAATLDRVLGGSSSVRRRLQRAGSEMTLHDYRVQQAFWGLIALAGALALTLLAALRDPSRTVPLLLLSGLAFVVGALLRDNRLTAQVRERERRMLVEFPTVVELLALAVAAGEGPVAALDRVVTRSRGELSRELARVLSDVRTGTPVTRALDDLAARTGVPVVARFAEAVAIALDRGTPLTEVIHAQAADVREAGRRALIETGARKEVLMMVPVVFLVLPVTVLFAFWPGVVGLRLVTP
jgi:tight adherence protein C